MEQTQSSLQKRLAQEQEHTTNLTTKLQVFSTELASREERVTNLNAKMQDIELLSAQELKTLQQELQEQVAQQEKLHQTAQDMARLLQERRDQCVRLTTQLQESRQEFQALDERVQTLASEVEKRESVATARIQAMEQQLEEEREQATACQTTATTTNQELIKKQEEFVMLTARMDLYLKELQFRDEQVASLESKLTAKEDLATSEIKELRGRLQVQEERRDSWNKKTEELQQLLKDKKAQVVGLTTRRICLNESSKYVKKASPLWWRRSKSATKPKALNWNPIGRNCNDCKPNVICGVPKRKRLIISWKRSRGRPKEFPHGSACSVLKWPSGTNA